MPSSTTAADQILQTSSGIFETGSSRHGDVGAFVRSEQKALLDKLFEQHFACRSVQLPQTTRLGERQLKSRHFVVFASNTPDKGMKLRRIAAVAETFWIDHKCSLHSWRPCAEPVFLLVA
jgi:hypothetical protein